MVSQGDGAGSKVREINRMVTAANGYHANATSLANESKEIYEDTKVCLFEVRKTCNTYSLIAFKSAY